MTYSTVIATLFRIINVAVLIAIALYSYKKYLKQLLIRAFEQDQWEKRNLKHDLNERCLALQRAEKQLDDDNLLIQTLTVKMEKWQDQEQILSQEHKNQVKKRIEILHSTNHIRERYIAHHVSQKDNITTIINNAQKELRNYFNNHAAYAKYMHSIMHTLEKKGAQK